jgi:23S rRNA pseudouridine2605 synthase
MLRIEPDNGKRTPLLYCQLTWSFEKLKAAHCAAFYIFVVIILLQNSKHMKKKTGFEKFHKEAKSGRALKEEIRQEKKQATRERKEFFEKKRQEKSVTLKKGEQAVPAQKTIARATPTGEMPLNKYLAHSGVCSRRDAAEVVKSGKVQVNGQLVVEPGFKVTAKDEVKVSGKRVQPTTDLIYILLNKPKDYITTTDDPQGRKTVLTLIQQATKERVYPVGRLDRNTSGVLLLTNDGDLSQKLTHPSNEIKKVYAVTLDRPLEKADFERALAGVQLEDGMAKVDTIGFTDAGDRRQVGVELHSGKNRVVRRLFEALGYDVRSLDRVVFAGLTKKNVPRGKWRFLSEKEVRDLKHFGKGK